MFSIEQIKGNLTTVDRQLLLMIYEQQVETNRLLRLTTNENKPEEETPDNPIEQITDDLSALKRQDLMKRMAKLSNTPQGWNRWDTEQIRQHLREVS